MAVGLEQEVEALIFASTQSITIEEIHQIIQSLDDTKAVSVKAIESTIIQITKNTVVPNLQFPCNQ